MNHNYFMLALIVMQFCAAAQYGVQGKWWVGSLTFTYVIGNIILYMMGEK